MFILLINFKKKNISMLCVVLLLFLSLQWGPFFSHQIWMGRELTLGRILGLDLNPPRILVGTLFEFWMDKWISVQRISFYFRRKPLKLCTPVLHPMFGNSQRLSITDYLYKLCRHNNKNAAIWKTNFIFNSKG